METQEVKTLTVEDVKIRAERQRQRAERWTQKCNDLEAFCDGLKDQIEKNRLEYNSNLRSLHDGYAEKITARDKKIEVMKSRINDLGAKLSERYAEGTRHGYDKCYTEYRRAIALGKKELKKQLEKRRQEKIDSLIAGWQDADNPASVTDWWDGDNAHVTWLRRAIKRHCGAPSHCDVVVMENGHKPPKIVGERGYHTTPSGKTVVTYPSAYKWRTVYHRSTARVEVSYMWITKNIIKLAESEAKMKIK
jgi:hypothetical protein